MLRLPRCQLVHCTARCMLGLGPVLQLTTLPRKTLYSDPRRLYRQESCSCTPSLSSSCPSEILQRSFSEFLSLDPSCPTVQSRSFHQSASPTFQSPVNINFISVLYSAPKVPTTLMFLSHLAKTPQTPNEGYSGPCCEAPKASRPRGPSIAST
jgi:hypothetical protein